MTNQDIINAIEELIDLTHCTYPAEDVVEEAVQEGERIIEQLRQQP